MSQTHRASGFLLAAAFGVALLAAVPGRVHDWLALALVAAIALHAALKHHWIDRDPTLARMLGRREAVR